MLYIEDFNAPQRQTRQHGASIAKLYSCFKESIVRSLAMAGSCKHQLCRSREVHYKALMLYTIMTLREYSRFPPYPRGASKHQGSLFEVPPIYRNCRALDP